jgi:hypothetical protein
MELHLDEAFKSIQIVSLNLEQLLPEAKERIRQRAMIDDKYRNLCKQVSIGGNINKNFTIKDELLCLKKRVYVPNGLRQRIMVSDHDSKVAGHFGTERTRKLLTKHSYRENME